MHSLLPFGEIQAGELEWSQLSSFKNEFFLHQGDRAFAMLAWRSAFGTLAFATTALAAWSFKRVGFWSPRVTVRREGAAEDLATFRPTGRTGWTGELRLGSGEVLVLQREGFWSTTWKFRDAAGAALVQIGDVSGVFRRRATVTLSDKNDPRSPLLSCLLWYLAVMASEDEAAVVAATG